MIKLKKKFHFNKIDSTSAYLMRRRFVLNNFTFVSCDFQTNGRGRLDRVWNSNEKENLLFSFLIKDRALIEKFSSLSVATATTIIELLTNLGVKDVYYKWPNDVYVNGKKICGILLNSISDENGISHLIVGVGLNVNQTNFDFDTMHSPTSIKIELNKDIKIKKLKRKVYALIKKNFIKIKNGDNSYLEIAKNNNFLKDLVVNTQINGKIARVKVLDINDDNTLKVDLNDKIYNLNSGEITFHV